VKGTAEWRQARLTPFKDGVRGVQQRTVLRGLSELKRETIPKFESTLDEFRAAGFDQNLRGADATWHRTRQALFRDNGSAFDPDNSPDWPAAAGETDKFVKWGLAEVWRNSLTG